MLPMKSVWFSFILVSCLWAQDRMPGKCGVCGTVIDSVTGAPLSKVEIQIQPVSRAAERLWPATLTDSKGHFTITKFDPGPHYLRAERAGYLRTFYGSKKPGASGSILQLRAGVVIDDLIVRMSSAGVLAGTVRESDGEPASGISVALWHWVFRNAHRHHDVYRTTRTDDLGQYRFSELEPGRYDIDVRDQFGGGHQIFDGSPDGRGLTLRQPVTQSGIEITSGSRLTNIDLVMPRSFAVSVTGSIEYASGIAGTSRGVELRKKGDLFTMSATINARGEFYF